MVHVHYLRLCIGLIACRIISSKKETLLMNQDLNLLLMTSKLHWLLDLKELGVGKNWHKFLHRRFKVCIHVYQHDLMKEGRLHFM